MPAIVTKDVRHARQQIVSGQRRAAECKRAAHRRHRAQQRKELERIKSGETPRDEGDFISRPGTGWDVW